MAIHPVAILSGRDLADIRDRVGIPGIWYAGSHGFELIAPDGTHHQNDVAAAALPGLESAAVELRDDLEPIPGVRVEHKRFAVAVHYRNVVAEHVAEVAAAAHRRGRQHGLRVTNGRKVVELRPNVDWDKGDALRWISRSDPSTGSCACPSTSATTSPTKTPSMRSDTPAWGSSCGTTRTAGDPTAAQFTLRGPGE